MGKKQIATKSKKPTGQAGESSRGLDTNLGKRPAVEPNEEFERKKKQKEDEERIEKEGWMNKMKQRGFICERQVIRTKMANHPAVESIEHQGLHFFFKPVKRYRKQMVKMFYENMVVKKSEQRIISQVGRVIVEVTPDSIARYWNYKRPDFTTYPHDGWEMNMDRQVETLTEHPNSYTAQRHGKYVQGKLRDKYRTLNKVVHYNLCPFSLEKTPTRYDGEVLIVFGSVEEKVDWAWWVWDEIRGFRKKGTQNANIPFPVMITILCEDAGCRPIPGDGLTRGCPGPIGGGTVKKSASASKPPHTESVSTSHLSAHRLASY